MMHAFHLPRRELVAISVVSILSATALVLLLFVRQTQRATVVPASPTHFASATSIPATVRVISERPIPSEDPVYPVGVEMVLETDRPIQPVAFLLVADGELGMGRAVFRHNGEYVRYTHTKQGIPSGHLNWFAFEWNSPAFTPDDALVVSVFSRRPIHIARIDPVAYEWP